MDHAADFDDPGLISAAETSLLADLYELTMSASYLRRSLDGAAAFELFIRRLPERRDWLLAAGLGPALRLLSAIRFDRQQLAYLASIGFDDDFCAYLRDFRFRGDVDAVPEGTVVFANEPLLRVTAPRIEAQLVETILLNQINFQTLIATKAARVVLAAGGGEPGAGARVLDFSPRRDHGVDAAIKVARAAAVAGVEATSNVAAARLYGLEAVGTMAHSYVMSFPSEPEAFRAFLTDHPERTVLLVDTYDTPTGIDNAIAASRETEIALSGIRLDSGDLLELSRLARERLDAAGMTETRIAASGDLEERRVAELVAAGAPIDLWGIGTELGTSRDSPTVNGVYKLVADRGPDGAWRDVHKSSIDKETIGGRKQVFRSVGEAGFEGDVIGALDEHLDGRPLLEPAMREGEPVRSESRQRIATRSAVELAALPAALRIPGSEGAEPYPVRFSERLAG